MDRANSPVADPNYREGGNPNGTNFICQGSAIFPSQQHKRRVGEGAPNLLFAGVEAAGGVE